MTMSQKRTWKHGQGRNSTPFPGRNPSRYPSRGVFFVSHENPSRYPSRGIGIGIGIGIIRLLVLLAAAAAVAASPPPKGTSRRYTKLYHTCCDTLRSDTKK